MQKTHCKNEYPLKYSSFAQKFSMPKSIIDELSAWSWKALRFLLELACCIGCGLFEFAQFELTFVPVIVPVIR